MNRISRRSFLATSAAVGTTALLSSKLRAIGANDDVRVAVIGLNGGLDYFLTTVFNYPTLAECYKVAALNAANKLAT